MRLKPAEIQRFRTRPTGSRLLPRLLVALVCALGAFGLLGLGQHAIARGWPTEALDWARERFFAATAAGGLVLREVEIVGRRETAAAEVERALAIRPGQPILAIDIAAAQARLAGEGWIAQASVARHLPDRLVVTIEERVPAAVWQHDGAFALIDRGGAVIARAGLERFVALPQLIGPDAPRNAAEILDALAAAPEVARRLQAAVRVGGRRWSLLLRDGPEVKLPETGVAAAIERLLRMQREGDLLGRDLLAIDLRLADRAIVRTVPRPAPSVARRP